MTEEKMKQLAKKLLLDPSEEVLILANKLLASIDESLKELNECNLDDFKPLSHINETRISFYDLRNDEINDNTKISKDNLLANAKTSNHDSVVIKKVINGS